MLTQLLLWAQQQDGAAQPEQSPWGFFAPMVLIFVVFYFVIILPAQRRDKKQRELLNTTLKKNDKIITNAGIIGTVSYLAPDSEEITLKLEEGKMKILRSSIARILSSGDTAQEAIQDLSKKG